MAFTLGALLADVPHTRPTQIIGTATDSDLVDRFELEPSRYEGPTGIVGVLHDALSRAGLPTASLWAAVPGYASQLTSPGAAIALIERACSMMGTPVPVSELSLQVDDYDAKVTALIEDDDDLVTYIGRLETMVDEMSDEEPEPAGIDDNDAGRLAAEVEQFLRERDDD